MLKSAPWVEALVDDGVDVDVDFFFSLLALA